MMSARVSHRQHGQSLVEFLVALTALVPMFLLVTYLGRYGDLQQTAVQASRYAAFQRAMQPSGSTLPDATIEDQMRARFFVQGDYLHQGKLQSDDSAKSLGDKGTPALWRDMSFNPILKAPTDATLAFAAADLNSGAVAKSMSLMAKSAGKSYGNAVVAQVDVPLVNLLDQTQATPGVLRIGAATAAAGDGLGSGGSQSTRDAAATIVMTSYVPKALADFLELAMELFEPQGPQFGCIKPDVVPSGRLSTYAPAGGCM